MPNFGQFTSAFLAILLVTWCLCGQLSPDMGLDAIVVPECGKQHALPIVEDHLLVLELRVDKSLRLNGDSTAEAKLVPFLTNYFSVRQEKVAYLAADDNVSYGAFVRLVDDLPMAGVDNVVMGRVHGLPRAYGPDCLVMN